MSHLGPSHDEKVDSLILFNLLYNHFGKKMESTTAEAVAANVQNNYTRVAPGIPGVYNITQEDSNWMVTSAFIIFTMQTGIKI